MGEGVRMAGEEREGSVVSSQNTSRGYVPSQQARDAFQKFARSARFKKSVKTRK